MKLTIFALLFISVFNTGFAQKPQVVVQMGLARPIVSICFSDDGKYIATASETIIKLFDVNTGLEIRTFRGHKNEIKSVSFSTDGKYLVSGAADNTIKLWETESGKELKTLTGHSWWVESVSFSPDGKYIVSKNSEDGYYIWDFESGQRLFKKNEYFVSIVFLSDSGIYAASKNFDGFKIWNLLSDKNISTIDGHKGPVNSVIFSSDGKFLLTGSDDKTAKIWDINTGKEIKTFTGHNSEVNSIAFSPDGLLAASCSNDNIIKIWDVNTGTEIRTFQSGESIEQLIFSPNSKFILSRRKPERPISIWEIENGKEVFIFESNTESGLFSPNNRLFVTGDFLGTIKLYDLENIKVLKSLTAQWNYINSVAFSKSNKFIASRNGLGAIKIWEATTGKILNSIHGQPSSIFGNVVFSSDSKYVISESNGRTINFWETETGKEYKIIKGQSNPEGPLSVSSDGKYLVTCNFDHPKNPFILWNLSTNKEKQFYKGHNDNITSIDISLNNQLIASGSEDNTIKLWNSDNAEAIKTLNGHSSNVYTVAFSPDGKFLASGSADYMIKVWEVSTGKELKTLTGHNSGVTTVCFSPDGLHLASGSNDNNIKLWDIVSGEEQFTLSSHNDFVKSVTFSADGKFLISGSYDGAIKLWDVKNGKEVISFISFGEMDYINVTPDYYYSCTQKGLNGIAFVIGNHAYPPEQFDLQYNRPDIVLERIGYASPELIESYRRAYEKRLKKMNFREDMFKEDFHIPVTEILTKDIPISTNDKNINFKIKSSDTQYKLDRLNVYVNDVPIYGTNGINLRDKSTSNYEQDINLELSEGNNKIQVSCLNDKGVESLKESFNITYNGPKKESKKYFIGIGVSNYQDSKMKLNYSVKDINDLANAFKENDANADITSLKDEQVTKENILALKEKLMKTNVDDEVIISLSGHGIVSKSLDFYYATYDMDFKNPESKGLMYDELDQLLDGIPSRKKLLLIDACNSGELDKENTQITENNKLPDNVKGIDIVVTDVQQSEIGLQNSFELMQEMFVNLTRGNGAVVISAAGGKQFAYEGGQWNNGVFTYCILKGLKEKAADKNSDGLITVSELKDYVSTQVEQLTNGKQKPTSRRENLEFDFKVW